jgi:hypothetical protein
LRFDPGQVRNRSNQIDGINPRLQLHGNHSAGGRSERIAIQRQIEAQGAVDTHKE